MQEDRRLQSLAASYREERKPRTPSEKLALASLLMAVLVPLIFFPYLTREAFSIWKAVALSISSAALLVSWALKCRERGEIILDLPYYALPLSLYFAAVILATLFSVDRWVSAFGEYGRFEGLPVAMSYAAIALLSQTVLKREDVEALLGAWMAVAIAISVYALVQRFGVDLSMWKAPFLGDRVFSTLGNPLYLLAYLVLTLPVAFSLTVNRRSPLALAAIALGIPALLATRSRSGLLAFAVVALLMVGRGLLKSSVNSGSVTGDERGRKFSRKTVLLLVAAAVAVSAIYGSLDSGLTERFRSVFAGGGGSMDSRLNLWRLTAKMVADRPILGYGPETFLEVSSASLDLKQQRAERNTQYDRAHNEQLQVLFSTGVLGLVAYFALLLRYFAGALKVATECSDESLIVSGLALGVLGYFVAVQFFFATAAVAPLMWLAIAVTGIIAGGGRKLTSRRALTYTAPAVAVACAAIFIPNALLVAADVMSQCSLDAGSRKDLKGEYENARIAAQIAPWQVEYSLQEGEALNKAGDFEGAAAVYRRVIALRPLRFEGYAQLAAMNYERKSFDAAMNYALKSLERYPLHYESRLIYALTSAAKGDLRTAEENLLLLQEVDPADYRAYLYLGRIYADMGNAKSAEEQIKRALALYPNDPRVRRMASEIARLR